MATKNHTHDLTEDWWDILMISPHASLRDIHQAYETLRMSYLPIKRDRNIPPTTEVVHQLQALDRAFRRGVDARRSVVGKHSETAFSKRWFLIRGAYVIVLYFLSFIPAIPYVDLGPYVSSLFLQEAGLLLAGLLFGIGGGLCVIVTYALLNVLAYGFTSFWLTDFLPLWLAVTYTIGFLTDSNRRVKLPDSSMLRYFIACETGLILVGNAVFSLSQYLTKSDHLHVLFIEALGRIPSDLINGVIATVIAIHLRKRVAL